MLAYYVTLDDGELAGILEGKQDVEEFLSFTMENEERCIDIDKAWAGIHFLLCGRPFEGEKPLFNAVLGGTPVGEEDLGYGPARILAAAEVRELAQALEGIDLLDRKEAFLSGVLGNAEIYPGYKDEEDLNYLDYYFARLKAFIAGAAGAGLNLLLYIG